MEKRVIVAVVVLLSFLVLYGYQTVFMPKPPARPAQSQAAAGQGGGTGAAAGRTGGGQADPAPPTGVAGDSRRPQPDRLRLAARRDSSAVVVVGDTAARDVLRRHQRFSPFHEPGCNAEELEPEALHRQGRQVRRSGGRSQCHATFGPSVNRRRRRS